MNEQWTTVIGTGLIVRFSYAELPDGTTFMTAQIGGHEVVYSIISSQPLVPFSRVAVEHRFKFELRAPSGRSAIRH